MLLLGVPALLVSGCLRDFAQFSADGGGDGDALGGATSGGQSAGDGDGDTGGGSGDGDGDTGGGAGDGDGDSGGTGGGDGDGDMTGGVGGAVINTCSVGEMDCDDNPDCEHTTSDWNASMCGGCSADCSVLGLGDCEGGVCGCAGLDECRDANNVSGHACVGGTCSCSGTECNPGETCVKEGSGARCSCGGGGAAACPSGSTCCPSGGGPSCEDLQSDDSNCGACGWQCPEGTTCQSGTCM